MAWKTIPAETRSRALDLLGEGLSDRAIARRLGLSRRAVSRWRREAGVKPLSAAVAGSEAARARGAKRAARRARSRAPVSFAGAVTGLLRTITPHESVVSVPPQPRSTPVGASGTVGRVAETSPSLAGRVAGLMRELAADGRLPPGSRLLLSGCGHLVRAETAPRVTLCPACGVPRPVVRVLGPGERPGFAG